MKGAGAWWCGPDRPPTLVRRRGVDVAGDGAENFMGPLPVGSSVTLMAGISHTGEAGDPRQSGSRICLFWARCGVRLWGARDVDYRLAADFDEFSAGSRGFRASASGGRRWRVVLVVARAMNLPAGRGRRSWRAGEVGLDSAPSGVNARISRSRSTTRDGDGLHVRRRGLASRPFSRAEARPDSRRCGFP